MRPLLSLQVNSGRQTFNDHRELLGHNVTYAIWRTTVLLRKVQVPTNVFLLLWYAANGVSLRISGTDAPGP